MGTKMGPNYAELFVGYVEVQIFSQYTSHTLELYGRYIDDCIGVTSLPREQLNSFLSLDQSFHPLPDISCTVSNSPAAFLDIFVTIHQSALTTSIHYKTKTHIPTSATIARTSTTPTRHSLLPNPLLTQAL